VRLTAETLPAQLRQRLLRGYLVTGDEPLRLGEAADAVRQAARGAGFSEREVHFIERASDWEDVRAAAATRSLFGARRILDLRLGSARPGTAGSAALLALLKSDDPDTLLLVTAPRLDRDAQASEWVRGFEGAGAWVQIWPVDRERLTAWLRERARALKLEADDAALEALAVRTEGNLLAADQELRRLALDATGAVSAAAVVAGAGDSARFDVFKLGETVLAGATARALRMLEALRAEGTEPTLVLWALTKTLRELWQAREGVARAANPWQRQGAALERAQRRIPRLSFAQLARRAERADRLIKGRLSGNPWDELALLVTELCAQPVMPPPAP